MTDTLSQYKAVREYFGFFDRSDMGRLAITGPDRFSWLQGMVSNDVRRFQMERSDAWYTERLQACLLDATGHLLSDLTLINITGNNPLSPSLTLPDRDFLLVEMPRANLEKVALLFDRYLIMEDAEIHDVSGQVACFSLQGPYVVQAWSAEPPEQHILAKIWYEACSWLADHTASGGADVYFPTAFVASLRRSLLNADVLEVGEAALEILRVEAGIPMYGADMDERVIALEAGLGPTHISLIKGCYVGQEIIARIDSRGHTNRALTGFVLSGESLPINSSSDKLFGPDGDSQSGWKETGRLTSVIASAPAVGNRPIALGYARHEHRDTGTVLRVGSPDSNVQAVVTELPFYRKPSP